MDRKNLSEFPNEGYSRNWSGLPSDRHSNPKFQLVLDSNMLINKWIEAIGYRLQGTRRIAGKPLLVAARGKALVEM